MCISTAALPSSWLDVACGHPTGLSLHVHKARKGTVLGTAAYNYELKEKKKNWFLLKRWVHNPLFELHWLVHLANMYFQITGKQFWESCFLFCFPARNERQVTLSTIVTDGAWKKEWVHL